jgi:WD40 repeat protein
VVIVDGVAGPRLDDIVTPSAGWIDGRAFSGPVMSPGRYAGDRPGVMLPVTFSHDGNHFAYVGREGEDWVLVEDNKEILRLPASGAVGATVGISGMEGNTDVRLQFSGEDGKHLLFARSSYQGYELWVDGQKWPGYYRSTGTGQQASDPLISPDGEHIAYVAQIERDKHALIVDGKDAGYFGYNLQYTPDSQHLISFAQSPKGITVQEDGKPLFTAPNVIATYLSPAGDHIAALVVEADQNRTQVLYLDGKPVEATRCQDGISQFCFSPDGKHYAAVCSQSPAVNWVVEDGQKGEEYDTVANDFMSPIGTGIAFSPDSTRLVYNAHGAGKYFVVVNGEESDEAFDNIPAFLFSPDGKHLVYTGGIQNSARGTPLIIDNQETWLGRVGIDLGLTGFSPDSSHYVYAVGAAPNGGAIYEDGKPTGIMVGNFVFSPDSRHIAIAGTRQTDYACGLWLDGQMVYKSPGGRVPQYVTFSADSRHLFWDVLEPDKTRPGYWQNVTYADGTPVAHADNTGLYSSLIVPSGYSQYGIHPGWQTVGQSGLACLNPVGDEIQRVTVTPTDTSLATLLAGAGGSTAAAEPPQTGAAAVKPTLATAAPAAAPSTVPAKANSPATTTTQANTNNVLIRVEDTANKTTSAISAFKHLFGR